MRARWLLVAALASACSDDTSVVGPVAQNRCADDRDCREGVCDLSSRRCLAVARSEVFFRVVPPDNATSYAAPTLTAPRSLGTGESVDLALRLRRTVYGLVAVEREADGPQNARELVPATVRFTLSDSPDVMSPVEVTAQAQPLAPIATDRTDHTWSATLPDGTYDVLVWPATSLRATVPPRFERHFDVRSDSVMQRFDVVYPAAYTRWSGAVRTRAGAPLAGLTVRAIDPTRNGIDLSTVSLTAGPEANTPGGFSVALAPGAPTDWRLRITSNVNARAGLVVEVPRAVCARLDETGRDVPLVVPTELGLPVPADAPPGPSGEPAPRCTGCVLVNASVEGTTATGTRRALRGATVTLRTELPATGYAADAGVRVWFEDRVQTDADGSFSSWLVPGTYSVVIEPADEEFANAAQSFLVGSEMRVQSGRVLTVGRRVAVDGRVLTATGSALRNARVRAVPVQNAYITHRCLTEPDMAVLAPVANADEGISGADGTYRLDLDPGLYRFVVEPPSGAGFATTLSRTECVQSAVHALDLVMDSPVEVHGTVRDPRGVAAPGARVEAVVRVREAGARGVSIRVAGTTAGADGTYTLLLPTDSTTP